MNAARFHTMRAYVEGQLLEFWEDPESPFGWDAADLRSYVDGEAWVTLFNAVMLTAARSASQIGS